MPPITTRYGNLLPPPDAVAIAALHLKSNRDFLYAVYCLRKDNRRKRALLLDQASQGQIAILLDVLRYILSRRIPIRQEHLRDITASRKLPHLAAHFGSQSDYELLKKKSLEEQKKVLKHISIWHQLLYNLFNKR